MNKCFALVTLLFFIYFINVVSAGQTIYLDPTNENGINKALESAKGSNEVITVHLNKGTYEISGPIYIYSNTIFTGDNAVIRVSAKSKQWFTGSTGIVSSKYPVENILIEGITFDGNCQNLPAKYASTPGHAHDCQKIIILKGYSNQFSKNITVKNCVFANAFSDAIYIGFAENVITSDNQISNCQHSSIYLMCVIDGQILNNDILGITSDCTRVENCRNVKVLYNTLHGYFGSDSNGAYEGGHNLVQVGNQGHSMGYGYDKPIQTENIEIAYNIFSGKCLNTILIDAAGKTPTVNLFIHDNDFVDMPEIENQGYSAENQPSIEETKQIFSNINDFLKIDYVLKYPDVLKDIGASATVIFNNVSYGPHSLIEVSGADLKLIKFEYEGNVTKYFVEKGIWVGDIQHVGSDLYIPGKFNRDDLKITVYSENGYQEVSDIEIIERKIVGASSISPDLFIFLTVLAVLGISITRNLRRIF